MPVDITEFKSVLENAIDFKTVLKLFDSITNGSPGAAEKAQAAFERCLVLANSVLDAKALWERNDAYPEDAKRAFAKMLDLAHEEKGFREILSIFLDTQSMLESRDALRAVFDRADKFDLPKAEPSF
jgi:hypothetical protein